MKTLFIDTHSNNLEIDLLDGEQVTRFKKDSIAHSEVAIPTLIELLKEKNIKLEDIDEIIVVNGPGSFTGIRIGVTIAKTLAYTLNIPIKTITSLEAYGESNNEKYDIVAISDSKGYYYALKDHHTYTGYNYLKKSDFESFIAKNEYLIGDNKTFDILQIKHYLEGVDYMNPHAVNPIYIKEIDVLK